MIFCGTQQILFVRIAAVFVEKMGMAVDLTPGHTGEFVLLVMHVVIGADGFGIWKGYRPHQEESKDHRKRGTDGQNKKEVRSVSREYNMGDGGE